MLAELSTDEEVRAAIYRGDLRVVVYEGTIRSLTDSQIHFLAAGQIMNCYGLRGVPPKPTVVRSWKDALGLEYGYNTISLAPQLNGDYSLLSAWRRMLVDGDATVN